LSGRMRYLLLPFLASSDEKQDASCGAALRTKPRARLCEPWVTAHKNLRSRGAATQSSTGYFSMAVERNRILQTDSVAAQQLVTNFRCVPRARKASPWA